MNREGRFIIFLAAWIAAASPNLYALHITSEVEPGDTGSIQIPITNKHTSAGGLSNLRLQLINPLTFPHFLIQLES